MLSVSIFLALHTALAAWPCDLTGAWYDNNGDLALISQDASGGLNVTSVSPETWKTASGTLTGNGTTLELNFGGHNPMAAIVSPTCWTLRFENMQQWQRGEALKNIVRFATGVFLYLCCYM